MFSVLLLQKECADPYPRAQLKVPHVTRFFLWESLCSCSFEIVWATQGQGPHSCALLSKGTVLSDHVLDHRFLPCSCGEVGSLSTPLECGLALWLIFTSRLWQKWYCVTFLTSPKSSAISASDFEHYFLGSSRHVRSLSSPMETLEREAPVFLPPMPRG